MKKKIKDFLESLISFENYNIIISIIKLDNINYITITTISEHHHDVCTYNFQDEYLFKVEGTAIISQIRAMENLFKNMGVIYND